MMYQYKVMVSFPVFMHMRLGVELCDVTQRKRGHGHYQVPCPIHLAQRDSNERHLCRPPARGPLSIRQ